ncbi:hypothetical protein [Aurantimonas endophytica]|uniref:Uncharacterized protein n=1 Tax=Aurantimonas endophytica TaxID=1522175 RepID=A0A7W6HDH7_9HYPH|nr:hypothetical protein [Aurantimonas endophytica]MBB4003224.1 hypothetical protein [Aurantimonas endophytica]MCO6404088.1 hypothetical protein [Aurantimonas endophytica]
MNDWYWAARRDGPSGDAFVIAEGKEALWPRVRAEIDANEQCMWMPIHEGRAQPELSHILDLALTVVPTYRVNHNRFVFEAAKIPSFAHFLRESRREISEYVSNSAYADELVRLEPYTEEARKRLGDIVSETLGINDDWFQG